MHNLTTFIAEGVSYNQVMLAICMLVAVECVALVLYWYRYRRGIAPAKLLCNIASGWCLMAALWVSLTAQASILMAGLLLMSLCFHVLDLALRWQS